MVYGALRSSRADDLIARFESQVWPILSVVPFGFGEAQVYGRLRSLMERAGTPISEPDLRIAAIAIAHDLTLVTGNVRHFRNVPDLRIENWIVP